MKITVSRASTRSDEYEAELNIPEILVEQLLNLGGEIPIVDGSGSWDKKGGKSTSFMLSIDPDTKEVEIMIYDFYVE